MSSYFFCSFAKPSVRGHLILSDEGRERLGTLALLSRRLKDQAPKSPEVADPGYLPISLASASPTTAEPRHADVCVGFSRTVLELLYSWFGFLKEREKGKKKKGEGKEEEETSEISQIMFCLQ